MASSTVMSNRPFKAVETLLGGRGVLRVAPRSSLDWVKMIRKGIPAAAVESLTRMVGVSQSELAATLGIPERTLARRKREGTARVSRSFTQRGASLSPCLRCWFRTSRCGRGM